MLIQNVLEAAGDRVAIGQGVVIAGMRNTDLDVELAVDGLLLDGRARKTRDSRRVGRLVTDRPVADVGSYFQVADAREEDVLEVQRGPLQAGKLAKVEIDALDRVVRVRATPAHQPNARVHFGEVEIEDVERDAFLRQGSGEGRERTAEARRRGRRNQTRHDLRIDLLVARVGRLGTGVLRKRDTAHQTGNGHPR